MELEHSYGFEQTAEGECSATVFIGTNVPKRQISVTVTSNSIVVGTAASPELICGELFGRVSQSSSIWQVDNKGFLTIHMEKKDGMYWPALIRGPIVGKDKSSRLDPHSAFLCAELYETGLISAKDEKGLLECALEMLEQAAEKKHIPALIKLSAVYSPSFQPRYPVVPDFNKRIEYATIAAELDCLDAMILLGILFSEDHEDRRADKVQATHWYRKASQKGQTLANRYSDTAKTMYALATLLREPGAQHNAQEAVQWLEAAAPFSAPAAYQLGLCYLTGEGCLQNLDGAHRAFAVAKALDPDLTLPQMPSLPVRAAATSSPSISRTSSASKKRNDKPMWPVYVGMIVAVGAIVYLAKSRAR